MRDIIDAWLDARTAVAIAVKNEQYAQELAEKAQLPDNLRPANSSDIVDGAILWYPDFGDEDPEWLCAGWKLVEEVRRPDDPYKAFLANDGCRYGLEGAFVDDTRA